MKSLSITFQNIALYCGIFSSLLFVVINMYVPMQYEGYNISALTVSELSAVGAPTRELWIKLVMPYPFLLMIFGWGIIRSSNENKALHVVGYLLVVYGVINIYWPPMHMRGSARNISDTLHLVWAMATVILMVMMMGFGAFAFGKGFKLYTIISLGLLLVFGVLTGSETANVEANVPTPWIGIWERINIACFMIWVIVLSVRVLIKVSSQRN